ncbi:MAG: hypothetical protein L6Q60_13440 [Rhodocyclaceae bacterium]|nr:hypothetical protein [Rhodocyclaceae bacterium]
MMKNSASRTLSLLAGALLLGCSFSALAKDAHAGHAHAHAPAATERRVDAHAAHANLPPLAARYDLREAGKQTDWYFWREQDRIEILTAAVGQSVIWERLGAEGYQFRRVFNEEQKVIEYVPGELRTRHAEPDWEKLSSIVSPHLLERLKRGPSKTLFGQRAVRYSGKVDGQAIELWWLERDQLPATLRIGDAKSGRSMHLRELHAESPGHWPRATEARIANYAMIDAADLGDMEYDPFVARLLKAEGHEHAH